MLKENLSFIGVCALVFAALLGLAYLFERTVCHDLQRRSRSRNISYVAMFSALGGVLMLLEIPLFFAPGFYKMDLSELPVLMSAFYLGPVAGVVTELLKVLLKLLLKGTSTAFVGDFANFVVGCTFVLPAAVIYHHHTLLFLFFCTKCSAGRVFLLTSGQMFRTIISSMESKTLYAGFCVTLYPFQAKRACLI